MNKKTLASLLPVLVLVVLALGAGFFLIKDEFKLPNLFNKEPEIRRITGYPATIPTNQNLEKQRLVITNEDELVNFLKSIDPTGSTSFPEKIDFNKEIIIASNTKTLDEGWTTLKVKKVYQDKKDKSLLISLKQTEPDSSCNAPTQKSVAYDVVAISKTDYKIDFEVVKEIVKDCGQFTE